MNNFLFVLLLIAILISAGCVGGNQNSVVTPTPQIVYITVLVTPTPTISITPNPSIQSKVTEPIIGKWIGTDEKVGERTYIQFFENGDIKWMVRDTLLPNMTWIKSGENTQYVNYYFTASAGNKGLDIIYSRNDDNLLIRYSGLKLYRVGNSVQFPQSFSQPSTYSGSVTIVVRGDGEYNWGEDLFFMGTDTNGKTVTLTSTSKNTGETRVLGTVLVAADRTWGKNILMTSIVQNHIPGVYEIKAQDGARSGTVQIIIN